MKRTPLVYWQIHFPHEMQGRAWFGCNIRGWLGRSLASPETVDGIGLRHQLDLGPEIAVGIEPEELA